MYSRIAGLQVAGAIFALVCLVQLLRLLTQAEVLVNGYALPLWPNAIALVIAGALSFWMFMLSRRGTA